MSSEVRVTWTALTNEQGQRVWVSSFSAASAMVGLKVTEVRPGVWKASRRVIGLGWVAFRTRSWGPYKSRRDRTFRSREAAMYAAENDERKP